MYSHPLLDAKFVVLMLHHFGNPIIRLAVETHGGDPVSAALIEPYRVGAWRSFLPLRAQIAPAMFGRLSPSQDDERRFASLLRELPGTPIMVGIHNQDTDFSGVAGNEAQTIEILPHVTTVGVTIEGTFEDYWHGRSAQLQENIACRLKRAEKEGMRISFQVQSSRSALSAAVAAHGDTESAGWKERAGTAIHRDNIQGRFYTDVLQRFAVRGGARAFQLYFGDVLVASQLAIEQNGMMVLLKTAHLEAFARYSPGHLLDYMMYRQLFSESRLKRVEYYTMRRRRTCAGPPSAARSCMSMFTGLLLSESSVRRSGDIGHARQHGVHM
jgi:hypothetical protein